MKRVLFVVLLLASAPLLIAAAELGRGASASPTPPPCSTRSWRPPTRRCRESILEKAEGIAVFPSLIKGGIVVGGQRGRGILSVRDKKNGGWSSPAFLTITGGSIGAQIGAQAIDLVLVINNQRGLEQLVKNQFKVGADAAVAAGPVGRDASASTDIQMRAQILSYSRCARAVRGRDAERIDDPPGSRRQRALLRHGVPHRPDRVRWNGRLARTCAARGRRR